jgi:GH15 family glucan-1,4-alpha-glucosidase
MDAALLLIPNTGFVDWNDPIMVSTTNEIMKHLDQDGFIRRYNPERTDDGVGGNEGVFIACTFWLVEGLAVQGRVAEARNYYDRALSARNELGLFSEQYDPSTKELLGNFPQALSHLAHINATLMLGKTLL